MKRVNPDVHNFKLTKHVQLSDVARVLLAATDVIDGSAFLDEAELERWLMDSCTDTNLGSRCYARRHKLRINKDVRITIGTAGGSTFRTDGEVWVRVLAMTLSGKARTIGIHAQVADIGSKCLINTAALGRDGYIMIQGDDSHGKTGSCLIGGSDSDPVVWFLDNDHFGMPILRTEGAPVHKQSRPEGLLRRLVKVLASLRLEEPGNKRVREGRAGSADGRLQARGKSGGSKSGKHWGRGRADKRASRAVHFGESDVYSLSDDATTSESSECYDSEERRWRDHGDEVSASDDSDGGGAASTSAGVRASRRGTMLMTSRKGKVVNTPGSWHNLVHAGAEKCVEGARQGEGLFNVPGNTKDKRGVDLTSEELKHFEAAASGCSGCKQLKMPKPKVSHSANAEHTIASGHGSRRD
jgi:hypothetical protein